MGVAAVKSNPLVSIIVPVYNVENYLTECIESIVHQTYKNIEIILVDDGSTDRSGVMCDEFGDDRIRVIHQKNQGLSAARNVGIEAAKGEVLSFIDSDDTIGKTMIESMLSALIDQSVDIVCCGFTREKHRVSNEFMVKGNSITQTDAIGHLYDDKGYKNFACNKIFKRDVFDVLRFPEGELFEDIKTIYLAFKRAPIIYYINEPFYFYRKRNDAITNVFTKGSFDRMRALNFVMDDCKKYDEKAYDMLKSTYASNYLYFLQGAFRAGKNIPKYEEKMKKYIMKYRHLIVASKGIKLTTKMGLIFFAFSIEGYKSVYKRYRVLRSIWR